MKNEKIDARKIDTKAQQEKRNIAMKLREKGMKNLEVAEAGGALVINIVHFFFQML